MSNQFIKRAEVDLKSQAISPQLNFPLSNNRMGLFSLPGPAGPTGPAGVTGATGPTGPTGASGSTTVFSYIGLWVGGSYAINTLAVDPLDNNTYVCIVQTEPPVLDEPPSTLPANWTLFANKGATGATGPTGATGANGSPGYAASGTVTSDGFTLFGGQYFKGVTVSGVTSSSIVVMTTSGDSPNICAAAWITTVVPTTDTLTVWTFDDPNVGATGDWEAHYIVASF